MTDERNKDLVRRHFEQIWNQRDLSACEELMAKDFVEHAAAPFADSPPGAVDGPRAMRGTVEWLVSQFPDIHMTIEALLADGDTLRRMGAMAILDRDVLTPVRRLQPPTRSFAPFSFPRATPRTGPLFLLELPNPQRWRVRAQEHTREPRT